MVTRIQDGDHSCRLVLQPNCSMTWGQTKAFFGLAAATLMTIAGGFALQGYWPMLPFAGLELVVLAVCLYLCALRGRVTEIVTIREDSLAVQRGTGVDAPLWQVPRAWAKVRLLPSRVKWYPTRLVISSHGKEVQVGSFLVEDERVQLAEALRDELGRQYRTGPTTAASCEERSHAS